MIALVMTIRLNREKIRKNAKYTKIHNPKANKLALVMTRNTPVDEIGERYRLNHAIVVQQLAKQLAVERCACKPLSRETPTLTS